MARRRRGYRAFGNILRVPPAILSQNVGDASHVCGARLLLPHLIPPLRVHGLRCNVPSMPGTSGTSLPVSWSAFMRVFTGANYSATFKPLSGEGVWMWNDLPYALPSRLPKQTLVRAPSCRCRAAVRLAHADRARWLCACGDRPPACAGYHDWLQTLPSQAATCAAVCAWRYAPRVCNHARMPQCLPSVCPFMLLAACMVQARGSAGTSGGG